MTRSATVLVSLLDAVVLDSSCQSSKLAANLSAPFGDVDRPCRLGRILLDHRTRFGRRRLSILPAMNSTPFVHVGLVQSACLFLASISAVQRPNRRGITWCDM